MRVLTLALLLLISVNADATTFPLVETIAIFDGTPLHFGTYAQATGWDVQIGVCDVAANCHYNGRGETGVNPADLTYPFEDIVFGGSFRDFYYFPAQQRGVAFNPFDTRPVDRSGLGQPFGYCVVGLTCGNLFAVGEPSPVLLLGVGLFLVGVVLPRRAL